MGWVDARSSPVGRLKRSRIMSRLMRDTLGTEMADGGM